MAYLLPNGVLRNRLGIADGELLAVAEADITRAKFVVLAERGLRGDYDLAHLQAFHRVIFGDNEPLERMLAGGVRSPAVWFREPPSWIRELCVWRVTPTW